MATITELIDLFHEDVCKLHVYTDIIQEDASKAPLPKQKFYSIDEYNNYQKMLI